MPDLVIDASVVLKWIPGKNEKGVEEARELYAAIVEGNYRAWAPKFLLVEVLNILVKKRKLATALISASLRELLDGTIKFWDMDADQVRSLSGLMKRFDITAYDAQYLLLAKQLGAKLVTYDEELLKARDLTVQVKGVLE